MRECADGIADDDPAVIENLLKLSGGFAAFLCRQVGLTSHIDRIERAEETLDLAAWLAQVIRNRDSQQFDRPGRLAMV